MTREDALDIVKLVQESIFEACYIEMGTGKGTAAMSYSYHMSQSGFSSGNGGGGRRGGGGTAGVDPNNVGMLSIPKQTKFFVERLRAEAESSGNRIFDQ